VSGAGPRDRPRRSPAAPAGTPAEPQVERQAPAEDAAPPDGPVEDAAPDDAALPPSRERGRSGGMEGEADPAPTTGRGDPP
jgi:hypothetical protein